ncbi:MAG: hypothetical protein ACLQFI_14595, partial [Methylocella sp.]
SNGTRANTLGQGVDLVLAGIYGARYHFVQYWLPEMCSGTVHQCATGPPAPAEAIAEPGHEFQPRRAAAYDHDVMKGLACRELVGLLRHQFTFGSCQSSTFV